MQFNVEHTITRKSQELVKEKFPSVVVNGYNYSPPNHYPCL